MAGAAARTRSSNQGSGGQCSAVSGRQLKCASWRMHGSNGRAALSKRQWPGEVQLVYTQ